MTTFLAIRTIQKFTDEITTEREKHRTNFLEHLGSNYPQWPVPSSDPEIAHESIMCRLGISISKPL